MVLVRFDYGYNTLWGVATGLMSTVFWSFWIYKHQQMPYVWKAIITQLGLYLATSLELLDFPPLFSLLDAHALWHFATIPIGYLWYSFIISDAQFCCKQDSNRVYAD